MSSSSHRVYLLNIAILLAILFSADTRAASVQPDSSLSDKEISVIGYDGTELNLRHYPADGEYLLVWVASSYSMHERIYSLFQALSRNSVEVWQIDFAEILFQPPSSNLMRNLDARYVNDIVKAAHQRTGKKIILMARAYAAIPVLRGATIWHQDNPDKHYLAGIVLFSPDLFVSIPELGLEPEYVPVTRATSIPVMIYQAQMRGTGWQLPRLLKTLRSNNDNIYFKVMPGVSGIFYQKDSTIASKEQFEKLPSELPRIFRLLSHTKKVKPDLTYLYRKTNVTSLMNTKLKPYKGEPKAHSVTLHDINGKLVSLTDYKGRVTVVNFWASWCPPCVHEIPSLNRLRSKMQGKRFKLISINYAEPSEKVKDFLRQVKVEFPVLLDTESKVSAQWNVIAFPSTFIVGTDGKIHYGVNAAIEWDSPEVIKVLKSLQ